MKIWRPLCHHCGVQGHAKKNGLALSGLQRYFCTACKKTFQTQYIYAGNTQEIERQVQRLSNEGHPPEYIARLLKVGIKMVNKCLSPDESMAESK